jgi:hypothetical protein
MHPKVDLNEHRKLELPTGVYSIPLKGEKEREVSKT